MILVRQTLLTVLILFSYKSFSQVHMAPPSFPTDTGLAVFIDITKAESKIQYDITSRKVYAETLIHFNMPEKGLPIFDLLPNPIKIEVDNQQGITSKLIVAPGTKSKLRVIQSSILPGKHTLHIQHLIKRMVKFKGNGVSSSFWMSDLSDRSFLERYLPSNLEFDQFARSLSIKITGSDTNHEVFTNGNLKIIDGQNFTVEFDNRYTASSVYFHMTPKDKFKRIRFTYKSTTNREVPVIIYSNSVNLNKFKKKTLKVLAELEVDYGPWPHPRLTIYGTSGGGGMEYSGATTTSARALGHELMHSYFARGMMPSRGDAGWIDEAIASWRDKGFKSKTSAPKRGSNMGNHSPYNRVTDSRAYSYGRDFLSYVNHELSSIGGLKSFLKKLFNNRLFIPIRSVEFQTLLEKHSDRSWQKEFDHAIYGQTLNHLHPVHSKDHKNPMHPKLNYKTQFSLL